MTADDMRRDVDLAIAEAFRRFERRETNDRRTPGAAGEAEYEADRRELERRALREAA